MVDSHYTLLPTESWHCAASTEWLKITLFLFLDMLSVASLFLLPICIHMLGLICACGLPLSFLMNTAILVHEGVCVCMCIRTCMHACAPLCDAMFCDATFDSTSPL